MKRSLMLFLWINTSVAIEYVPQREEDLPQPAVNIIYQDSKIVEVLVDEWKDTVLLDGERRQFSYQQGYNYNKKQGFSRTVNPDGSIYHEKYSVDYSLMVSKEEMMTAFEIFKSHPKVIKILNEETLPISLYGGFSYKDEKIDEPCYKGNRCVHIMASSSANSLVIHSIVKLNDKTVPYPVFDMEHLKRGKK